VKKAVMVCTFILAFAAVSSAQSNATFGAKVGANFANLDFSSADAPSTSSQTGLVAGVFGTVPVSGRFSFQPELLFSQQGAKVEDSGETGKIKLNYFNVPLLGNVNLSNGGGDSSFSLLFGPQLGFRTSAEFEGPEGTEDLKDDTEKMDIAAVVGLGATIRNFVIDARYQHGLRNIATDSEEGDIKNRVFTISVGILFR
jgi:hypothetical protein